MRRKTILILIVSVVVLMVPTAMYLLPSHSTEQVNGQGTASYHADATGDLNVSSSTKIGKDAKPVRISSVAKEVPGMEMVVENATLALYMNKETTEIAVFDKRSSAVWFSNPQDRDQDGKATPFEKGSLGSQFSLTYLDNDAANSKTLLNYNDSIEKKQFVINPIPSGVQIVYTLGDTSKGLTSLPKFISKKRFDQFMSKVSKDDAVYVLKKYTLNEKKPVYERFDLALANEIALTRVTDAFLKAGYTETDLTLDNAENKIASEAQGQKPVFVVPLEYHLDNENLIVTIPTDKIKEPSKFLITQVELSKYFGTAGLTKKGYMFVPDGSGSLIHLNNGKFKDDIYSQPMYGEDEAIRKRTITQTNMIARLPIFGLKSGDSAFYGIIENGSAVAAVNAEVSGRVNSYNYVYSKFNLRSQDILLLAGGTAFNEVPIVQSKKYQGDLSLRFGFLYGKDAGYEGMAKAYQDYLLKTKQLKPVTNGKDTPFYLDLIGDIPKQKSFLGIPYESMQALTTFSQAQSIVEKLKGNGIDNIKLRYLGWFNAGVNHKIPTTISPDSALGGGKGLNKLTAYLKTNGVDFFPDVSFIRVLHDSWNFFPSSEATRYPTRMVAMKAPYDLAFNRMNSDLGNYYTLSPSKLPSYVDRYLNKYKSYGIDGLSIRYMGSELDPDYRVGKVYDRQLSADIITEQLKKISNQVPKLMVIGGNAYALPYAKSLIDVPMTDTHFLITDETVPFYQMVMHGVIPYAGQAFNLADDQDIRKNLLKSVEYGANVRFEWIYAEASLVKETMFDTLYSVQYQSLFNKAKSMYEEANLALKDVQDQQMVGHRKLQEGVFETSYANGKTIIVNYNNEAVNVNGMTIESLHYGIGEAKG